MNRRQAARMLSAAFVSARFPSSLAARLAAAAPPDSVRFSVMLWTLTQHTSFDRSLEIVSAAGYQGVELVGEFHAWPSDERRRILDRMRNLNLAVDAMSGVEAGFAVPAQTEAFLSQFAEHLRAMEDFHCTRAILLSGPRVPSLSAAAQRAVAVENLKRAAALAARQKVEILIEPIDLLENPSIFLASVTDAFEIARAVAAPNLRVLYDLYHEQRSFGNLIEKLEQNIDLVGLLHVADVPGRHQPGTGEINFPEIYRRLAALHYDRWIAMEFYPTGEPVATLKDARLKAEANLQVLLA
jgi:hydroxypyruvate isomerase